MASDSSTPCWDDPKFSLSTAQQSEEWKVFYTKAIDFLEALNIDTEEEDSTKKAGSRWKCCLRVKTGKHSRCWLIMGPSSLRSRRTTGRYLMLLPPHSSLGSISGTFEMSSSQMCASSQMKASTPSTPGCAHSSTAVGLSTMRWRKHWRSWYSSIWWGTMRPGTGSSYKTSPSWPARPFSTTASCLSPGVSSTRRPRRRARPTSLPFWWPHLQCLLFTQDALTILPKCSKCSYSHPHNKCLAYGEKCFNCAGLNHYTALCIRAQRAHWPFHDARGKSPQAEIDHSKTAVPILMPLI